jgi:hypothetical protein
MTLSHTLKRIRLNLARSKEFPSGSSRHGYELVAPLDHFGHIDPHLWQRHRNQCQVRRFWQGEDDQIGPLIFAPGEYVSIHDDSGELHTFQVTSVQPTA